MDQYEDLQKFREKTRMKSIRFVDFTKQNKEINHGQWTIVHQLANANTLLVNNISPEQPSSQRLHTPVTQQATDPVHFTPITTTTTPTTSPMSLLKDVGLQLNQPETFQSEVTSLSPIMASMQTQVQQQAAAAVQPQPAVQSPTNFSHLFAAPVEDMPVTEKETPLQSLLKRIATCR